MAHPLLIGRDPGDTWETFRAIIRKELRPVDFALPLDDFIKVLAELLGEDFLTEQAKLCGTPFPRHPIYLDYIYNASPPAVQALQEYVSVLQQERNAALYGPAAAGLANWTTFRGWLDVLETIYSLRRRGFQVEYEPKRAENVRGRRPDLLIEHGETAFCLELTRVLDSKESIRSRECLSSLHWWLVDQRITFAMAMKRYIARPRMAEVKGHIAEIFKTISAANPFAIYDDGLYVSIAFAVAPEHPEFVAWCADNHLQNLAASGPGSNDQIRRIRGALTKKASQFSDAYPNGLLISHEICLDEEELILSLREDLFEQERISFVLLSSDFDFPPERPTISHIHGVDKWVFGIHNTARTLYCIVNPYARRQLPSEVLQNLRSALARGALLQTDSATGAHGTS